MSEGKKKGKGKGKGKGGVKGGVSEEEEAAAAEAAEAALVTFTVRVEAAAAEELRVQFRGGAGEVLTSGPSGAWEGGAWTATFQRAGGEPLARSMAAGPLLRLRAERVDAEAEAEAAEATTKKAAKTKKKKGTAPAKGDEEDPKAAERRLPHVPLDASGLLVGEASASASSPDLRVTVTADRPVLDDEQRRRLLPARFSLAAVEGLRSGGAAAAMTLPGAGRVVRAAASSPAAVCFLGDYSEDELATAVATRALVVELHDADELASEPAAPEALPLLDPDAPADEQADNGPAAAGEEPAAELGSAPFGADPKPHATAVFGAARFSLDDIFGAATSFELSAPVLPVFPRAASDREALERLASRAAQFRRSRAAKKEEKEGEEDDKGGDDAAAGTPSAAAAPAPAPAAAAPQPVALRVDPYSRAGAEAVLRVRLAVPLRPLHHRRVEHRFTRAVYVLPYADSASLRGITEEVANANARALGMEDAPRRALVNVHLTDEQAGSLDLLTGFHVTDGAVRVFVVEGLRQGRAMADLVRRVPRPAAVPPGSRYLINAGVTFPSRAYAAFHAALRHVRLREPLAETSNSVRLYLQRHVPAECLLAFDRVRQLLSCTRLWMAKAERLFPSASGLVLLDRKYGGFVSDTDLEGAEAAPPPADPRAATAPAAERPSTPAPAGAGASSAKQPRLAGTAPAAARRRGIRDSMRGDDYVRRREAEAAAPRKNHLAEYRRQLAERSRQNAERCPRRRHADPSELELPPHGQVFVYSGQKLEYSEWQRGEVLRRIEGKSRRYHFSYSRHFASAGAARVLGAGGDAEAEARRRSRGLMRTAEGFVLHAPKTALEDNRHPDRPGTARREELASPHEEAQLGWTDDRGGEGGGRGRRPKFDTVPAHSREFGFPGNEGFHRSVHSSGVESAAERDSERRRKAELWRSKVVVDKLHVTCALATGGGRAILHDPPRKRSLRYRGRLRVDRPSGSLLASEPYRDPRDRTISREVRPDRWVAARDFARFGAAPPVSDRPENLLSGTTSTGAARGEGSAGF